MGLKFEAPFDPDEEKDYVVDWSAELTPLSDTIETVAFEMSAEGTAGSLVLYNESISVDNKKAVIWVKSTNPSATETALKDKTVNIKHVITTVGDRKLTQTLVLKIKNK